MMEGRWGEEEGPRDAHKEEEGPPLQLQPLAAWSCS